MNLTKGTLQSILRRKVEAVIPAIRAKETAEFEKFLNDKKVKEILEKAEEYRIEAMKLRLKVVDLDEAMRHNEEKLKELASKTSLKDIWITGETCISRYNFLNDRKNKYEPEKVEVKFDPSSECASYQGYDMSERSKHASEVNKKIKEAFTDLQIALETNNKQAVLQMIKDFQNLKV
jgi:hypothetical protein